MRVLLLDEGFVSGASAAFGLHAAGCDVDVLAAVGGDAHGSARLQARCDATGGTWRFGALPHDPTFVRLLERETRERRYDVVWPTTEPLQRALWPVASRIGGLRLPAGDAAQPAHFADKRRMSRVACDAGAAIPGQTDRVHPSNLDETIRRLGLPIVIKGAVGRGGRTTFIAASAARARAAIAAVEASGTEAFAQQYIHGPTCLVGGLFHRGTPVRLYAAEKHIQVPARTGPAAVLVSRRDEALIQSAARVFQAVGLTGLASADFVRAADGRVYFIELNPRPWGSIAAARAAGVDLFGPLVDFWRGRDVASRADFTPDLRAAVFPLVLASGRAWAQGDAGRSLADALRAVRTGRVRPRHALHLARRALRVARNW